ncbi:MAG: hypothetical protein AAGF67_06480 [Verrucomicrobiota bacterium]
MIPESMSHRAILQSNFRRPLASIFLCLFFSTTVADEIRTWTSGDGRQLQASLVHLGKGSVTLKLGNGREAEIPLSRLSAPDQKYLATLRNAGVGFSPDPLPEETRAPDQIEVSGGPEVYLTPHFSFETEEPVSKAFISEAARIYEGTFEALNAIPHGLTFAPPEGSTHFKGSFMSDQQFSRIASARMPSLPGQRVVGLYLGDEQRLLVPYSSLGAKRLGSRLTLRKRSDTTTLVHEIVHQVMHQYLPLIPTWFAEGMAEYVSALPYQNGRFEFRNAERGLKERLAGEFRIESRKVDGVIRPSSFLAVSNSGPPEESVTVSSSDVGTRNISRPVFGNLPTPSQSSSGGGPKRWTGTVAEYRDALLLVYFFMHLDRSGEDGMPIGEFLHATNLAMSDTDQIVAEIEKFEAERIAYNEEVTRFNKAVDEYRAEAVAYNERVTTYNNQLREGVPDAELIEVGNPPAEPERPGELVMPERLRELSANGQPIDLVAFVEKRALVRLTGNRSGDVIDEEMKKAFDEIGIEINYRP